MLEIFIGVWIVSALPKTKFYEGRLGTKHVSPPIKPQWISRVLLITFGLAAIIDGVWRLRHP